MKARPAAAAHAAVGLALLACVCVRSPVDAQERLGPEFQVNTYTTNDQVAPSVAMDAEGNFVVVWQSSFQLGYTADIFGQRFTGGGARLSGEFPVSTYTTSNQTFPSVAREPDGDFVVVWTSYGQDGSDAGVFGQRFLANALPNGSEFPVNTYTTSNQARPSVAIDAAGNFVVVWASIGQDGSYAGIYAQRFDGVGEDGLEFRVNTYTTSSQGFPAIAMADGGDFVVVWESLGQDGDADGIFGQRFTPGGSADEEFPVNTYTTSDQSRPSVAMDGAGDFVVVWRSNNQDFTYFGIHSRRFASDGAAFGGEFLVGSSTTSIQLPSVAMDDAGNFVVVWQSFQGASAHDIFGQRFTSGGAPLGDEFRVNTYTTSDQRAPAVAMGTDGTFVVVWQSDGQDGSNYGIFGQRFRFGELDFFIGDDDAERAPRRPR